MRVKDERKELQELLNNSPSTININVPDASVNIPGLQGMPLIDVDLKKLNKKCEREARIMMKNAVLFMVPQDMIESNEYLKNKVEVDIMSLAGMIYQLRINQTVQNTLTQQISSGLIHARYFEVFAGMSKTIGELNKQLIQTVEAIRNTWRSFKDDVKEQRTEALGPSTNNISGMLTTSTGSVITRGTKELINNVKRIKSINIQQEEYLDENHLIPDIHVEDIEAIN
jgi:hypothetical protein